MKNACLPTNIDAAQESPALVKRCEKGLTIYDFVGILSKKESRQIKQAIKECCEGIDADEWV